MTKVFKCTEYHLRFEILYRYNTNLCLIIKTVLKIIHIILSVYLVLFFMLPERISQFSKDEI